MPRRTEAKPLCVKVGARIREFRKERGMSLQDLAEAGAMSKGHLSSIEQGLAAIDRVTLMAIRRLYRCDPHRLTPPLHACSRIPRP
ncbi:helix-turn-helix domain-containing protein [Polyangium jinanense]|uniref:Helix-turn-helix transcriptional regulator n=1 Tax=Polyangium jinanense TaxID=2829994 RepID=A0A9X3XC32_9BACT|nr:helix-turn-helix transcriptional regulator [Polyangium jinanense]MDC3987924.1 helix-turn-helix transcriptional regulator [Polyangium jinanense]